MSSEESRPSQGSQPLSATYLYNQHFPEQKNHLYSNFAHSLYSGSGSSTLSWTRCGHGHGKWGDSYGSLGDYYHTIHSDKRNGRNFRRRHEHIRLLVILCKSFCFVVLMVSFIFVIVIVSVFLAKGIHNHI